MREHDLPRAPAKATTPVEAWIGGTCQLEALPPDVIAEISRGAIERRFDWVQFND